MNTEKLHFIVIDDSKLDCFIAEKIIQNTGRCETVHTFQQGDAGLKHIAAMTPKDRKTVLFVDIQMPVMNGFEVIETFEKLPEDVRNQYDIYMLSSSINENDISRVKGYSFVKEFLNKPLTARTMAHLLEKY